MKRRLHTGMFVALAAFVIAALFLAVLLSAWDWSGSDLARHPDEAGHFITGAMGRDWIAHMFTADPLTFAKQYYAHLPRVSLGHWPPVFYVIQALWYSVCGVSPVAVMALAVTISSLFLAMIFSSLRSRVGTTGAAVAAILVATSPTFLQASSMFMADVLTGALTLAAVLLYRRYLTAPSVRRSAAFGFLAAAALLTKQDALALAAVPPVGALLARRGDLLKTKAFYLPLLIVVVLAGPFYLVSALWVANPFAGMNAPPLLEKLGFFVRSLSLAGTPGLVIAGAGLLVLLHPKLRPPRNDGFEPVVLAWGVGVMALHLLATTEIAYRFTIPMLPLAALLVGHFVRVLVELSRSAARWSRLAPAGGLAMLVVCMALGHAEDRIPIVAHVEGYTDAVADLPKSPGLTPVLICSDARGDGALISAVRLTGRHEDVCVFRADKNLASSSWMGRSYRLELQTPAALKKFILDKKIKYVILDEWGVASGPHGVLLKDLIDGDDGFAVRRYYDISRREGAHASTGRMTLVEVLDNSSKVIESVKVPLPSSLGGGEVTIRRAASAR